MAAELKVGIGAEIGELVSGLNSAIAKIQGFANTAQSKFKDISTEDIQNTIGKLNTKILTIDGNVQVFGDSLSNSKKALDAYQTAFDDLVGKGMDPTSKELQTITEEINRLNGVVSASGTGINSFEGSMNKLGEQFNKVGQTLSIGLTAPIVGFVTTALWANKETKTAFDNMKNSISTSMGRIGKSIDETLHISEAFEKIAGFVKDLTTAFQNLDPSMQKIIAVVGGVLAAAGPLLIAVGKFIQFLPLMVEGIGGVTGAFKFLLGPIGLVTAAIIGVVTAVVTNWSKITPYLVRTANNFIQLYNESETFRKGVLSIGFAFEALYTIIKSFVKSAWNAFLGFGKGVLNLFEGISIMIRGAFAKDPTMIAEGWRKANQKVAFSFDDIGSAIGKVYDKYDKLGNNSKPLRLLTEADLDFKFNLGNSGFEKVADEVKNKVEKKVKEKTAKIELPDIEPIQMGKSSGFRNFLGETYNSMLDLENRTSEFGASIGVGFAQIPISLSENAIKMQEAGIAFSESLNSMISEGAIAGITDAFNAMGEAMFNGSNILAAAGGAILGTLGQFMQMLGTEMIKLAVSTIALGTLVEGIKKFIIANPGAAIALAGVAIVAGALLKGFGSKVGGGSGGSSGSTSTATGGGQSSYSSSFSSGGGSGEVNFRISGNDLVAVLSRQQDKNSRLGG